MSDSRRTYRVIKKAFLQLYPSKPQGNLARHLTTLVGLVSGIGLSKSCQLPKVASKAPGEVHPDSRTKQFRRWVNNDAMTFDLYFLPFLASVLGGLAVGRPLVLVMDGSVVARVRHPDGQGAVWRTRLALGVAGDRRGQRALSRGDACHLAARSPHVSAGRGTRYLAGGW